MSDAMENKMQGTYGERSEEEKAMPQWRRDALDRRRMEEQRDMNTHPALWSKLVEIEGKLDALLKILRDGKS